MEIPDYIKPGTKFTGKWIKDTIIEIIGFDAISNLLHVHLSPDENAESWRQSWDEGGWNLQHTIWGFEKGDYKLKD